MHEDFVIYLSFPSPGGGAAHLRWPTARPVHSGPAIASLADALRPPSGYSDVFSMLCNTMKDQ
jgi:hypothetical protein